MESWADGGVAAMSPGFAIPSAICDQAQYNDGYDPPFSETAFLYVNRQNQEPFTGIIGPILPYYQEESL